MKEITKYLTESHNQWDIDNEWAFNASTEFMWINTEGQSIGFMSEKQVKSFVDDFGEEEQGTVDDILALKVGEMYDSDAGINLYVRIK